MSVRRGWIVIAAIFLFALFLRHDLGMLAIPVAPHDDGLFFRLVTEIQNGNWLGKYERLTLAKGPMLSMIAVATSTIGIPFKTFEYLMYLGGATLMAWVLLRQSRSWGLTIAVFAALAIDPVFWGQQQMRFAREPTYVAVSLAVFAAFAFLILDERTGRRAFSNALVLAFGSGILFAAFWLTREESVWLYPALAVLFAYGFYVRLRGAVGARRRTLLSGTVLAIVSAAGFAIGLAPVLFLNWSHYGVWATTEFRQGPFQDAYGALTRITVPSPARYVPVPHAALKLAYSVSPAAAELRPALEGATGKGWMGQGCASLGAAICSEEIASGWFVWALRDAAAEAGHYVSGSEASGYFTRLAREINAACDTLRIPCDSRRRSFAPPISFADTGPLAKAMFMGAWKIAQLETSGIGPQSSSGDSAALAAWGRMLGRIAPEGQATQPKLVVKGWVAADVPPAIVLARGEENTETSVVYRSAPDVDQFFKSAGQTGMVGRRFVFSTTCMTAGCRMAVLDQGRLTHQVPLSEPLASGDGQLASGVVLFIDSAEVVGPTGVRGIEAFKYAVVSAYAQLARIILPFFWIAAALGFLLHIVFNRGERSLNSVAAIAVACLAAVGGRVFLLGYLEVTSWQGSVIERYLAPAYPFGIIYAVCGTYLLLKTVRVRQLAAGLFSRTSAKRPVASS